MKQFIHCDDPEARTLQVIDKSTGEILKNVKQVDTDRGIIYRLVLEVNHHATDFKEAEEYSRESDRGCISKPIDMRFVEKVFEGSFEVIEGFPSSFVLHHPLLQPGVVEGDQFEGLEPSLVIKTELPEEEAEENAKKVHEAVEVAVSEIES